MGEVYLALLQMCIIPIMITAVLSSLGRLLKSGEATAVILLAAIDPILDPVITLTTVHANCAASTMIAKIEKRNHTK